MPRVKAEDESHVRWLIKSGRMVVATKFFRDRFALNLADSKLMVYHMHDWARPLGPPCSKCGKPLRTPRARICVECGTRLSAGTSDAT